MNTISTILVPFDFSDVSKTALEYAVHFAGRNENLEILLVYVQTKKELPETDVRFASLREKYARDLKIPLKWIEVVGSLTESLIKIQETHKVDMVIMGTSEVQEMR